MIRANDAMAPEETISLIERFFAALNARDITGTMRLVHEDIVHDKVDGNRQIGTPAFERFLINRNLAFRERFEAIEIMTNVSGLRLAAEFAVSGTYEKTIAGLPEASGQRFAVAGGMFFEISDGAISRITRCGALDSLRQQLF